MADQDKRFERYRIIDEQLRRFPGKGASMKQLIRACGVSENTIYTDLEFMKTVYKAPINNSRKMGGYYYTELFVLPSIENLPLSKEDLNQLTMVAEALNQFESLVVFGELRGTLQKLGNAIKYKILKTNTNYSNKPNTGPIDSIIQFESVPSFKGSEMISFFYEVIEQQKEVTFEYEKFVDEPSKTITVQPYWLKEHKNRWYVVGEIAKYQQFIALGLDRIIHTNESYPKAGNYFHRKQTSFKQLNKYSFGLYISKNEPVDIILSFTPTRGKYLKAQPLFNHYKVLVDNSQEYQIQTKLIINQELTMELVKLGADVKVIKPESLINKVKSMHRQALNQYE